MGMLTDTTRMQAPFRFEPIDTRQDALIVNYYGTPVASCWDEGQAREVVALLNRGAMDVAPQHPEVQQVLDRWNGQLPLEIVALILGLDAKLSALSPGESLEAGAGISNRSAA